MQTLKNKFLKSLYIFFIGFCLLNLFVLLAPSGEAMAATVPPRCAHISRDSCCKKTTNSAEVNFCLETNGIVKQLKVVVNFLAAGVGVVVAGSIIFGGIQYAAAGNNPNLVSAAKKRITDSLIALMAFIFLYAFLQWILPGGIIFS